MAIVRLLLLATAVLLALAPPGWSFTESADVLELAGGTTTGSGESATIMVTISPFSFTTTGTQTLGLLDPGTNVLSDLLTVTTTNISTVSSGCPTAPCGKVTATLTSDPPPVFINGVPVEQGLTGTPDFTTPETGDLQDVTSFFTILNGSSITVGIQSDVGEQAAVPEPGSLILLSSGLMGLAGVAWRRHRK